MLSLGDFASRFRDSDTFKREGRVWTQISAEKTGQLLFSDQMHHAKIYSLS